ncbi:sugar ABC transporter substrate-binding protein, partial [Pseudomonas fragi]|nr:sugar ABC transporter substrate-binding protein [Pseudomonas sp. GC01]
TADQAAAEQAVYGIQTALKLLKNEPVENLKDGVIDTPVELITKK